MIIIDKLKEELRVATEEYLLEYTKLKKLQVEREHFVLTISDTTDGEKFLTVYRELGDRIFQQSEHVQRLDQKRNRSVTLPEILDIIEELQKGSYIDKRILR